MCIKLNIQLFADAQTADTVSAESTGGEVQVAGEAEELAEPQSEISADNSQDEREKAYNEFIKEHKDLYQKNMDKALNKRFKAAKVLEEENKALKTQQAELEPMLDILKNKYGAEDVKGLLDAIENDDNLYEELAFNKGMSVEQYKEWSAMQRENAALKAQQEEIERKQQEEAKFGAWLEQAEDTKRIYPDFDLLEECKNPQYLMMLDCGVHPTAAYQALHMKDVLGGFGKVVAEETQLATAKSIASGGSRPTENGSGAAVKTGKTDIKSLTAKEMEEIDRRVLRGEKITF